MLHIIWGKIKNNLWLISCLLIGNILLIATVSSVPMYSTAVMQRIFIKELEAVQLNTGKYPGLISLRMGSFNVRNSNRMNESQSVTDAVLNQIESDFGVPVLSRCFSMQSNSTQLTPTDGRRSANTGRSAYFRSMSGFEDHVEIIQGNLYGNEIAGNVIEAVVSETAYNYLDLLVGEVYELTKLKNADGGTYLLKIAGVFKIKEGNSAYWSDLSLNNGDTLYIGSGLFQDIFLSGETQSNLNYMYWDISFDYHEFKAANLEDILGAVQKYRNMFKGSYYTYSDNISSVTTGFDAKAKSLNITLWVLEAPIFILLVFFIFMVTRQILALDQNEIAVIKSRGGTLSQIMRIYLGMSAIVAGAALVSGIPLGIALCGMLGSSSGFLEFVGRAGLPLEFTPFSLLLAVGTALFSVATMVIPAIRFSRATIVGHKQKKAVLKKPFWRRFFLDFILLAFALYELFSFSTQKDYLAESIAKGTSLDPLLFLSSSLFMLGSGLLFIRLFSYLVKLIYRAGKSSWSPSLYASFLKVIRSSGEEQFIMIFLVLTLATGVFNACIARTINLNNEHALRYYGGADIAVKEEWIINPRLSVGRIDKDFGMMAYSEAVYYEPDYSRYTSMPGAESVTKVFVSQNCSVYGVGQNAKNNIQVMGIVSDEFGRTAWFRDGLLPSHFYEYLNVLAQNPEAVIVSSQFRDIYNFSLGDKIDYTAEKQGFSGIICGFVDYWPGYDPLIVNKDLHGIITYDTRMLIVANLANMQRARGVMPYEVWIKAKGGDTGFIYDEAERSSMRYEKFSDIETKLVGAKNDAIFQGTNGMLTVGFIIILVVCMVGFLIYWILSIRSRELQFGIFRAMGLGMSSVLSMLAAEQILVSGSAILAGIGLGALTSYLFVPLIQMGYSSGTDLPLLVTFDVNDSMRLFILTGVMLAACMAVLGTAIRNIRIAQALKLGED